MTDLLAAALAGLAAWAGLTLPAMIRGRRHAANWLNRLGPRRHSPPGQPEEGMPGQRVLLQGLALRVARTRRGSHLSSYVAANHPGVAFSDFLAMGVAATIGGALAGTLLFGGGLPVVALALGAPFGLERVLLRRRGRRSARIERQLPDALALQAGTLRAGHSLIRSLRVIGAEAKPPLCEEVAQTLADIDLGQPVEEALLKLSNRSSSHDIELWVTSMLVHRQTGGNLAGVVDSLGERVTQRLQLRGEIRALTAQGRLSGLVVAMAPVAFLLLLSVGSREQMQVLYSSPVGWVILTVGLVMNGLGLLWIKWILRIKP